MQIITIKPKCDKIPWKQWCITPTIKKYGYRRYEKCAKG